MAALPAGAVASGTSDAALFTIATYGAQILLFIAGVVQKRLLGPTGTGYWALMTTFLVFFSLAPLGTADGAGRQIPFHRGRNDPATAGAVADTASSFAILACAIAGLLVAAVAFLFGASWRPEIRYGLVVLGLLVPLTRLSDAHEGIMQATKRFKVSSLAAIVRAAIALTIQTLSVWLFGFYGMFVGLLAASLATLVLWNRLGLTSVRRPAFRWKIERARLRELARFGVPIMLQGQIWALFLVVDNLIVAGFLNVKQLGYYAVACSATTYIMLLPKSIGSALAPRMSERFGQTREVGSIEFYATEVQRLLGYMLLPAMVGAAFFLMPVLIRQALPAFTPAIPVVRIMVAGSFFISLTTMPIKVLLAAGYRWSVTNLTLLSLAINAVANYVAVPVLHAGLTGAAYAVAFSYFAAFVILTVFALTRTLGWRRAVIHVGELIGVFAYVAAAMWGIELVVGAGAGPLGHDCLIGVGKLAILLAALTPWLVLVQVRSKALTALWSLVRAAIDKLTSRRLTDG